MNRLFSMTLLVLLAGQLSAAPLDTGFSYQGQLNETGTPANGSYDFQLQLFDAASSGNSVAGPITVDNATVSDGLFTLELDFGVDGISSEQLWLQIGVRAGSSTGSYTTLSPRTKLTAGPAALYALAAGVAESVALGNVITVATVGGDFSSVVDALNSISDAAPSNPYLVQVAAGEFIETDLVLVPADVHLRGSGVGTTIVASTRSSTTPNNASATVEMEDNSRVSDMTIENRGSSSNFAIGVLMNPGVERATALEDVRVEVNGSGGVGHYAVYLNDAQPSIRRAYLRSEGALGFGSAVNAGLGVVNQAAGFPRPLIADSTLLGGSNGSNTDFLGGCVDPTGTGFGIQATSASPEILRSNLCGGHRGISVTTNGIATLIDSRLSVSSTSQAFMVETTGSGRVQIAASQVSYVGNKHTGAGAGMSCALSFDSSSQPVSDGTTTATACN